MWELIQWAFSPVNVLFTGLLILVVLYWVTVILGALDIHIFDVDVSDSGGHDVDVGDIGHDVDVDVGDMGHDVDAGGADHDVGAEVDHHGAEAVDAGPGLWHSVLLFFGVGRVPMMVLVSVLVLSLWFVSMVANYYLNPGQSMLLSAPIFAANVFVSLMVLKTVSVPLRGLFKLFMTDANAPRPVIGRICIVITSRVSDRLGQAEVRGKGAPIVLNCRGDEGRVLKKGDEAIVVGLDKATGVYLIAPVELEKRT